MTPFAAESSQALLDVELAAISWLFRSVPFGALVLLVAVVAAVAYMSWNEVRLHPGHGKHARA